jgi:hypothetical protein
LPTLSSILIAASAATILLLGLAHLLFTFRGPAFMPRDRALAARMEEVAPVISVDTTMWKAWIGFNASHSFGAILFGAVYGYLALLHPAFLAASGFLLALGLLLLGGYLGLARRYWFRTPFRGILLALVLYAAALVGLWA